ncbi:hypothetical protein ACQCT3_17885 [Sutcliffiella horikoshii]|uniref:hypothetical protein n=1 Tax=Sutcliffiella horikoshii TaxID=79883 RepID=UPI003CE6FC71
MDKKYIEEYDSKVVNARVRIVNEVNIELLAKSVILCAEAFLAKKNDKNGR